MKLWKWPLFTAILTSLALISERSAYSITDVKSINWDIALMLSPWGFVHNFLIDPNNYLRPYYDSPAERGALFSDPALAALVAVTIALAVAGLYRFRREGGRV